MPLKGKFGMKRVQLLLQRTRRDDDNYPTKKVCLSLGKKRKEVDSVTNCNIPGKRPVRHYEERVSRDVFDGRLLQRLTRQRRTGDECQVRENGVHNLFPEVRTPIKKQLTLKWVPSCQCFNGLLKLAVLVELSTTSLPPAALITPSPAAVPPPLLFTSSTAPSSPTRSVDSFVFRVFSCLAFRLVLEHFEKAFEKRPPRSANLDFDARVPIPFSVFPSSYRSDAVSETTHSRVEGEVKLTGAAASRVGREDTHHEGPLPAPRVHGNEEVDHRYSKTEYRPVRTQIREDYRVYEEAPPAARERYPEVDLAREQYYETKQERKGFQAQLDVTEHEYRRRTDPNYSVQYESVRPYPNETREVDASYDRVDEYTETYKPRPHVREVDYDSSSNRFDKTVEVIKERRTVHDTPTQRMGYYDDEGQYHSFRRGVERAADRILHPFHHHHHHHKEEMVSEDRPVRREAPRETVRVIQPRGGHPPGTITIPCHFIRIGDLLILQGRPCQVIRISVSAQTGQHRYLGVDLFTGQLHEESSFVSNPSPSVVVQSMLGPVYKTYRILDLRDDGHITAMTDTGDIKQGLRVIDQGGLFNRISDAFADGRGSVRALVINDGGRELVVDYKVIHGSRL
ncbi:hypothetical protein LOZ66_000147 [Ophidiomyces ophidiicola]|nr:hypothetical protein LOZ66_000147 [Ophidiomyces ophidiicola]